MEELVIMLQEDKELMDSMALALMEELKAVLAMESQVAVITVAVREMVASIAVVKTVTVS